MMVNLNTDWENKGTEAVVRADPYNPIYPDENGHCKVLDDAIVGTGYRSTNKMFEFKK